MADWPLFFDLTESILNPLQFALVNIDLTERKPSLLKQAGTL